MLPISTHRGHSEGGVFQLNPEPCLTCRRFDPSGRMTDRRVYNAMEHRDADVLVGTVMGQPVVEKIRFATCYLCSFLFDEDPDFRAKASALAALKRQGATNASQHPWEWI